MLEPDNDPLGIGLQSRAWDRKFAQRASDQQTMGPGEWNNRWIGGPAPDPQWEGWFQALNEAGVDNLASNSVGIKKGMFPGPAHYTPLQNPLDTPQDAWGLGGEGTAVPPGVGTPLAGQPYKPSPALAGLKNIGKGY